MKLLTARGLGASALLLALASSTVCLAQSDGSAVIQKFAGTWKEDQSKRKIGAAPHLRFRENNGQLEELRGPDQNPLVQKVIFGTKPYGVDRSTNSIEWKKIDDTHFERRSYAGEKLLTTRHIEISGGGTELTEISERGPSDTDTTKYTGSAGRKGLAGDWKPVSMVSSTPAALTVVAEGASGFRTTDRRGVATSFSFDGKPHAMTGPSVISGTMRAAKIVGSDRIEIAESRDGIATGATTLVLSNNARVLTETRKENAGSGQTSVRVFDKQ